MMYLNPLPKRDIYQNPVFCHWIFLWDRVSLASLLKDHQLKHTLVDMLVPRRVDQWLFLVPVKGGRWHTIPQLAVYTLIYDLIIYIYIAFWGVICYLPPFMGTRNNHGVDVCCKIFTMNLRKHSFFRWGVTVWNVLLFLSVFPH